MSAAKRYLFVCIHNAGRSQMAEAFVNHYAAQRGLLIQGHSAGTMGGKALNPLAVQAMAEIGISMEGHQPKLLTQDMIDAETTVITMGCGVDVEACPARFLVSEDWGLDDPAGREIEAVRSIRDQIRSRVERLLDDHL